MALSPLFILCFSFSTRLKVVPTFSIILLFYLRLLLCRTLVRRRVRTHKFYLTICLVLTNLVSEYRLLQVAVEEQHSIATVIDSIISLISSGVKNRERQGAPQTEGEVVLLYVEVAVEEQHSISTVIGVRYILRTCQRSHISHRLA